MKVFDLRAAPRLLTSVPFHGGAAMLAFHPKFSATLLIASTSGAFSLADTGSQGYAPTYQARHSVPPAPADSQLKSDGHPGVRRFIDKPAIATLFQLDRS